MASYGHNYSRATQDDTIKHQIVVTWSSGGHARDAKLDLCLDHSNAYEAGVEGQRYDSQGKPICKIEYGAHRSAGRCDFCIHTTNS